MFMRIWMEAKMLKVDCGLTWPWNRTRRHQQTLYPVIWWSTSRNQVLKERVPFKQALMMTREDIQKLLVSKKSINDITWQAHCPYRRNHSCKIDWSFGPSCWTCSSRHVFWLFCNGQAEGVHGVPSSRMPRVAHCFNGFYIWNCLIFYINCCWSDRPVQEIKKIDRSSSYMVTTNPGATKASESTSQGVDSHHLDICNRFLSTTWAIFLKTLVFRGSTHSLVKQSRHPRLLEANPKLWNNLGCPFYCGFNWISLFLPLSPSFHPLFPLSLS